MGKKDLGATVSLPAAASLVVDHVLTVAVSLAAGAASLASAFPSLQASHARDMRSGSGCTPGSPKHPGPARRHPARTAQTGADVLWAVLRGAVSAALAGVLTGTVRAGISGTGSEEAISSASSADGMAGPAAGAVRSKKRSNSSGSPGTGIRRRAERRTWSASSLDLAVPAVVVGTHAKSRALGRVGGGFTLVPNN